MEQGLDHWADILVIVVYFVFVLAVGLWSLCRPNRSSVKGYFLAGRDMIWWPVGASLFASNIGSEHFIGLAGTGAASGIAIVWYEWASMLLVLCLGWLFLPVYISAGVYTLPEYLERRFGGRRLRMYLSCLSLLLYVATKISVSIYAGALFIQLSLGWDMYLSIFVLLAITCVYTVLGGLAAVIYTDALQTGIMTIGAIVLAAISFNKVGGYEGLKHEYMRALPNIRDNSSTCGYPRDDAFHIFRHPVHSDNPWPGLLLQASLGCLWYWCADQVIVQRALAAKNLSHAQGGCILAGYLKITPLFLIIFPGMISRALYPDEVGCIDAEECERVCGQAVGCSNIAYPQLVMTLLPVGLRGLLLAVMMSAIMSSLTSIFNSSSTIFTMDIWRHFRKSASQRELIIIGRVAILVLCGVSILWIPLITSSAGGQLFVYIQAIQGYIGTPIGALFLLSVFWRRMNEKGAFWGILVGHVCGITWMVLDFVFPAPECGREGNRPKFLTDFHYTYFGQVNLLLTALVGVGVSLATKPDKDTELAGVTWWTMTKKSAADLDLELKRVADGKAGNVENSDVNEVASSYSQPANGATVSVQIVSVLRRWFKQLCGIPERSQAVEEEAYEDRMRILQQSPKWRKILSVNAVIAVTFVCFLLGFYH